MKRFSSREMALLMAPVLVIVALGWWVSNRPKTPMPRIDNGKVWLVFHVLKPTTLEAFQGYDCAFEVEIKGRKGQMLPFSSPVVFLELKTPRGVEVSRRDDASIGIWRDVWGGNSNNSHFTMKMRHLPSGILSFGFAGSTPLPMKGTATLSPAYFNGKWLIDRTRIRPPGLAKWSRAPLVTLREVRITKVIASAPSGAQEVAGEAIFVVEVPGAKSSTAFEIHVSDNIPSGGGSISWGVGPTKETVRRRSCEWTVYPMSSTAVQRVSGRVSIDHRWPLGFEVEPFRFNSVKVGQRLKFKQFAVPLPKG